MRGMRETETCSMQTLALLGILDAGRTKPPGLGEGKASTETINQVVFKTTVAVYHAPIPQSNIPSPEPQKHKPQSHTPIHRYT